MRARIYTYLLSAVFTMRRDIAASRDEKQWFPFTIRSIGFSVPCYLSYLRTQCPIYFIYCLNIISSY